MKGIELVNFLMPLIGSKYVLGATVPKAQAGFTGPFDCAEFVAYGVYQTYGIVYGCEPDDPAKINHADAFTGYFGRDAQKFGKIITVAEAAQIPGAIILRLAAGPSYGHIVVSQGNGKTVEANCTKYGCIQSVVSGRRFDYGILLPGVEYKANTSIVSTPPKDTVYKLKSPYMKSDFIKKVQIALGSLGSDVDGVYGPHTQSLVVAFQKSKGLIVDGELTESGETASSLFEA